MAKRDEALRKPISRFVVPPGRKISLRRDYNPGFRFKAVDKKESEKLLAEGVQLLAGYQDKLYAQNRYALLVIIQAMDAAGKDGIIKHVMSGLNPQGCQVYSFKAPSPEELDHDYLWRCFKALPERGRIGIFNRSYYEEVLIVRVHPELLEGQRLPPQTVDRNLWKRRLDQINAFERYLVENGIVVLKFFLNISKAEQKKRFLERIDRAEKNWKFSESDVGERAFWNDYMRAYEDCFNHTSTEWAPWHIIPADAKWVTRIAVAAIISHTLEKLDLQYPKVTKEHRASLLKAKALLEAEK